MNTSFIHCIRDQHEISSHLAVSKKTKDEQGDHSVQGKLVPLTLTNPTDNCDYDDNNNHLKNVIDSSNDDLDDDDDDDEKSLTSTVSVSTASTWKESLELSFSTSSTSLEEEDDIVRPTVRFDDEATVYVDHPRGVFYNDNDDHDDHDHQCDDVLWYKAADYQRFKSSTSRLAKLIHKRAPLSYTHVLEQVYQECCKPRSEEELLLLEVTAEVAAAAEPPQSEFDQEQEPDGSLVGRGGVGDHSLLSLPPPRRRHSPCRPTTAMQNSWPLRRLQQLYNGNAPVPSLDVEDEDDNNNNNNYKVGDADTAHAAAEAAGCYCVGLETRLSRLIAKDRSSCRSELTRLLYTLQMPSATTNTASTSTVDDQWELLRWHCQQVTQRSRLFAHLLAQAQHQETVHHDDGGGCCGGGGGCVDWSCDEGTSTATTTRQ
ncbi:hypothetical protein ACA910_002121 [Epithemia clementina (nom. ined.)]